MTGMKNPLQSTLLSPTSSKLMTQYIVKTNLNHHYNKLQNAKARIDNSLPDSMLKSQKIRDRKRQESRPHSSKSSQRAKSRQSSRSQSQFSNHGNLEEHWMGQYGDALEAEVERIVQMTLNGRSQDLQQEPLYTQNTQDYIRQTNATHEDTVRSTSRSGQMSSMSRLSFSARSFVSNSEKLGMSQRSRTRRENQDLLKTNAHLFTEPDKPFVPKILKSNRSSLLNQYKYYNSAKKVRPKQAFGELDSSKFSDSGETGKGETPVPKPRQKSNLGNTLTLSSKTQYLNENCKRVPPLDIPVDEDQNEFVSEQKTLSKKSTRVSARDRAELLQSQSAMDLPRSPVSLNLKSQSLMTQSSETRDEIDYNVRMTPKNSHRKKHMSLNSDRSLQSTLGSNCEETDYTTFMKEVTEEILMKGLYTNGSIQRVFQSHMRKRKGQLNEDEMKKMLNKLQTDLGISPSDTKEISKAILQSSSSSAESLDPASAHMMKQSGNDRDQDRDLLKQYEEKLTQDESLPLTQEGQSLKGIDVLNSSNDDQEHRVQEFGVKSNKSGNPGNPCGGDDLVEEKTMKISESEGTAAQKPVPRPRPRPRRKNSTTNLVSNVSSSDLPSVPEKQVEKSISKREIGTENNVSKSQTENSTGIGSQNSNVSKMSSGRGIAEEHSKRGTAEEHPKRGTAEEHSKRGTAEEHPKRRTAEEHPKRRIAEEHSKRGTAEEHPKRGTAEEHSKRGTAEEHPKHADKTPIHENATNFDLKPNSMKMKKDSPKSEILVSPKNSQKDKPNSQLKTPEEDNYDDDFEDDDFEDDSDSDF